MHQTIVFPDRDGKQQIAEIINQEALHILKGLAEELIPESLKVSFLVSENHLQFTLQKLLAESFYNIIFAGIDWLTQKIFIGSMAVQIINNTKNIIVAMPKEITVFSHKKIFVAVTEKYPEHFRIE